MPCRLCPSPSLPMPFARSYRLDRDTLGSATLLTAASRRSDTRDLIESLALFRWIDAKLCCGDLNSVSALSPFAVEYRGPQYKCVSATRVTFRPGGDFERSFDAKASSMCPIPPNILMTFSVFSRLYDLAKMCRTASLGQWDRNLLSVIERSEPWLSSKH
jgi:hypothetical protein